MARFILFGVLLLGLALQSAAGKSMQQDVRVWLERMIQAVRSLNYEGTFVYLHDNHLESMHLLHRVNEGGEWERLVSLNGAAREVVRDSASVTCVAPDARSVSIGGSLRAVFTMDLELLSTYYDFRLLGSSRVAGREARVIAIIPNDRLRYGYRIYLDQKAFLPLQTEMLDSEGQTLSQVMFTRLEVKKDVTKPTESILDGKEDYAWVNHRPMREMKKNQRNSWLFQDLPAGFGIRLHTRRSDGPGKSASDHYVLSDGLASLSVYIEKSAGEVGLRGGSQMGTVNAFGREVGGRQVTVVGEVPAVTVKQVAAAIRPAVR
jgi:sigma-E factor negative regulatory protein RseB